MQILSENFILPRLRQDLRLLKGTADEDGAPRWMIYDAVGNKYYTISRQAFDLIRAWQPGVREGANKRGNSSRLTQSFHFFLFEPFFSPVNALNESLFRPFLRHLRRYSQFLVRSLPLTYHLVHPKQVGQGE